MRYYTLLFFLVVLQAPVICQIVEKQSMQEFVDGETLKYSTDGSGKSNGLKLNLKYPKSWAAQDGEGPHIVETFIQPGNDAAFLIMVQSLDTEFTQSELDEFFTLDGLKYALPDGATFISANSNLKIESLKAGSLEYSAINTGGELSIYTHCLNYFFVYKKYLIALQCYVSSTTGESNGAIDNKFYTLNPLFELVFNSITLDNVWTD